VKLAVIVCLAVNAVTFVFEGALGEASLCCFVIALWCCDNHDHAGKPSGGN
jgi:hypothetical protein